MWVCVFFFFRVSGGGGDISIYEKEGIKNTRRRDKRQNTYLSISNHCDVVPLQERLEHGLDGHAVEFGLLDVGGEDVVVGEATVTHA